jgi:hypothetical protein
MRHQEFGRRRAMRVSAYAMAILLAGAAPAAAKHSSVHGAAGAPPSDHWRTSSRSVTWHVIEPDGSVGPLLGQALSSRQAAESGPQHLAPGDGCPPGTTNYPGAGYTYRCRNAFRDSTGYEVILRIGRETVGSRSANDGDEEITKGFGLIHAQEDHNVGPHSIALIVNSAPPQQHKETKHPDRFLYQIGEIAAPEGDILETLNVVVQKAPDRKGLAPDKLDFGVITAFCSVGTNRLGYPGYCSNDLPRPFNGGAGN